MRRPFDREAIARIRMYADGGENLDPTDTRELCESHELLRAEAERNGPMSLQDRIKVMELKEQALDLLIDCHAADPALLQTFARFVRVVRAASQVKYNEHFKHNGPGKRPNDLRQVADEWHVAARKALCDFTVKGMDYE